MDANGDFEFYLGAREIAEGYNLINEKGTPHLSLVRALLDAKKVPYQSDFRRKKAYKEEDYVSIMQDLLKGKVVNKEYSINIANRIFKYSIKK